LRYVHHVGRCRLNDDGLIVSCYRLLGVVFKLPAFKAR
jgi:hypothetical protein